MSRTGWMVVLVILVALVVFRASPRGQLYDSRYTLLVSHQLIDTGDPRLDGFVEALGGLTPDGRPRDYRIVAVDGAYHWFYPAGTPLLAMPFVAVASGLGHGPVDGDGHYDRGAERRLQRWLAASAMALCGALFLLTARELLPPGPSLVVAAGGLFASPVFSTASRSLWSQSAAILLVAGAVLLIVRGQRRDASIRPVLLASLLAWAWMCRPTAVWPAVAVTAWVALCRRDALMPLVATGAAWAVAFAGFHLAVYGSVLPPYHVLGSHTFRIMPEALLGNWISPARGLIVYSPIVIAVFGWAIARRHTLPAQSLAVLATCVIGLHWILVSSHAPWWGGYGYGPRLMAETVPWIVLLAALTWSAERARPGAPRFWPAVVVGALLVISIGMHGVGAISRSAADWNHRQAEPDFASQLWSVRDAPFLAPLHAWRTRNDGG